MIISQTPLRISFAGGGTDLAAYYASHTGFVVSTAIDKGFRTGDIATGAASEKKVGTTAMTDAILAGI